MVSHRPLGPEHVAAERAASADPVAVVDSVNEELLGVRVLRQVRTGLDVERDAPDCLADFDALVLDACEHPAPLPNRAE